MAVVFPASIQNTTPEPLDRKTVVATLVERNAIPEAVRFKGLQVTVQEYSPPKIFWLPGDDLTNTGWIEKTSDSSNGDAEAAIEVHNTDIEAHEDIRQKISDEAQDLELRIGELESTVENQSTDISNNKITSISFDQALKKLSAMLGSGIDLSVILPEVTLAMAGLMSPADLAALQKAISDIQSIKEGGVWRATYATKADLESSFPGLDVSGTVWTQNDFIYVDSDESRLDLQGKPQGTSYIVSDNSVVKTLQFRRIENTPIAQATNNSMGVSKGTPIPTDPNDESADGKQYSENDGSWSTIGWDKLKGRVSANEAVKHSHVNKTFLDGLSQSLFDEKVNRVIGWTTPSDPSSINNSLTSIFVAMTVNETKEVHFTSSVMNAFTDAPTGMTSIGNAKITLTRFGATGLLKFTTTNTGGFNWFAALNNMTTTPSINWYRVATNPESISQITASTPTSLLQSLISVALDTPNSSTRIVQFSSASIAGFTDTPPLMTITGTPAMQVTVQRGTNTATIEVALLSASATRSLWKGILITLTTTPAWLQALSLVDMAYPTNDRNNPSTWALNTEINFGDGTFGYRRTGNIVAAVNAVTETTIYSSAANVNLMQCGGWIMLGQSAKNTIGQVAVGAGAWPQLATQSGIYSSDSGIRMQSASIYARTGTSNNAYDVWVRYTKA